MNKFNTIEDFFAYAFTQAETIEQRIALYFVKEGHMLPNHLEKVTWEDIDLNNHTFKSFNARGSFQVKMSEQMFDELIFHKKNQKNSKHVFTKKEEIDLIFEISKKASEDKLLNHMFHIFLTMKLHMEKTDTFKSVLNNWGAHHKNGDESYVNYLRTVAELFEESEKLFLFGYLYTQNIDLLSLISLKWKDIAHDYSFINIPNYPHKITVPADLKMYLKRNIDIFLPNDIVFPISREWEILRDTYFILLANKTFVNVITNPNPVIDKTEILEKDQTRLCLKAWNQIEITENGSITPCCIFPANVWDMHNKKLYERKLRVLRESLLDGKLNHICATCDQVRICSKSELKDTIKQRKDELGDNDMLSPLPMKKMRIGVTDVCNLRCTYCSVSDDGYAGKHMKPNIFNESLNVVKNETTHNCEILLCGHGETTFHPRWQEYAKKALATGRKISTVTNLAKKFSDEEIDLLSQYDKLIISLDSNDEEMMMKIRRKIKPSAVFEKVKRIQKSAKRQGLVVPFIEFNIVIYNPSIWTLVDLTEKLVELQIDSIGYINLNENASKDNSVTSIRNLNKEETKRARSIFYEAVQLAKTANIKTGVPFNLICSDGLPLYQENLISQNNNQPKKKQSLFQRLNALLGKNEI